MTLPIATETIVRLYRDEQMTEQQIAKRLGCSQQTVGYRLRKAGVSLRDNPTESGASEYVESCKVAHEALRMENQRITPARFKCLACGDYHEGSGNLPCPKMRPMSGTSE